ncbi:Type IV secretory system Conjugative DNA transfer [Falsiroseomonas stagni DSM 19981]|uniref:Type IV secretory system Conjugative DNA transfer n=2 Tax=Falsiroseomonas TaxID=2870713 RepID=A0A1I4FAG9_9PROT|nr:type IV secretory system conjugative DNA transfer family protein [Falsiroseomonas stagni]SFL13806.1 Type IV secretory system Conjugative DNA transfer [Falsiroseomonas stagni DSM 19981]
MRFRKSPPASHDGPLLGWLRPHGAERQIGFRAALSGGPSAEPVYGDATDHHLVFGPTGSGKTRSIVIPGILDHCGPMVILDVKGELFRATQRHAARSGRRVLLIDPFRLLPEHQPVGLDLLQPIAESEDPAAAARSVAESFSPTDPGRDMFWSNSGNSLLAAALHDAAARRGRPGDGPRNFSEAMDLLTGDDVVYAIARMLDTDPAMPAEAHRGFATFLQMPEITRGGVLASAQAPLRLLSGLGLRQALSGADIDLTSLTTGDNIAVYLAWPQMALKSHGPALRLFLSLFLDAIFRRKGPPSSTTLVMVDEAGTIGPVPQIETAFTLARGYGCRVTAIFQSIHQMEACYGTAGRTVFDNAGTISVLPPSNARSAQDIAGLLGLPAECLTGLGHDEALAACRGHAARIVRRLDYLSDARYAGKFDDPRATPGRRR